MTPYEEAQALYAAYETPRSFAEDLALHLRGGYVISTPEYFLMGRAIDRFAAAAAIENPAHAFPREQQNAWLVYLFSGSSRNILPFLPYPLKWVTWQRRGGPLRHYELKTLRRHAHTQPLFQ